MLWGWNWLDWYRARDVISGLNLSGGIPHSRLHSPHKPTSTLVNAAMTRLRQRMYRNQFHCSQNQNSACRTPKTAGSDTSLHRSQTDRSRYFHPLHLKTLVNNKLKEAQSSTSPHRNSPACETRLVDSSMGSIGGNAVDGSKLHSIGLSESIQR
jgi:hypothetical protein